MKKKIIIIVLILITIFAVSFVILKLQTNKGSEIIENNTSESVNNDNLEELEHDNKEDELADDNSNDEEKIIEQESPKESQTTKEEKKINNSSSNNTQSSNQNKKEKSSSNKQDNKQSVESKPVWEELGISEYDYYHKPMWSWAKIDYSVDAYGTEAATHQACIDAGNKLENITSYTCYNINSYSGDYLGDMLEIKEG